MSKKLEDIKKYLRELNEAYDGNHLFYRDNTDRSHNAAIMLVMLQKSHDIKMYCGEMSVFRTSFYDHIKREDEATADYLRAEMTSALSSYLREGKNLNIILENQPTCLKDTLIPKADLKSAMSQSHFQLMVLPDGLKSKKEIGHFAYGDTQRILRLETNKENHEATCRIGTEPISSSAYHMFATLEKIAEPVEM